MIMIIAIIYIFLSYVMFHLQLKVTFRKFSGPLRTNPLHVFTHCPPPPKNSRSASPPIFANIENFFSPPYLPPQTERGKDTMTDLLPCNPGSAVRIVLQFCTMNVAKRDMGIILMVFLKEILFTAIWSFWNKKWYGVFLTLNLLSGFF